MSRAWCATSAWPKSWRRTRWWPRWSIGRRQGVPDNPGAWLMATAKNRALDRLRRDRCCRPKLDQIGQDLEAQEALIVPDFVDALDEAVPTRSATTCCG